MKAGQRGHRLATKFQMLICGKSVSPIVGPGTHHIALEPWHNKIRRTKPPCVIAGPFHGTVRHIRTIERIEHSNLSEHIRGAHPLHPRRRQANKPGFDRSRARDTKPVSEARMARHDHHFRHFARFCVMRCAKHVEPLPQFIQFHGLSLPRPLTHGETSRVKIHLYWRFTIELLPKHPLENFAAGVARYFVDELNHLRLLKTRKPALAELQHLWRA